MDELDRIHGRQQCSYRCTAHNHRCIYLEDLVEGWIPHIHWTECMPKQLVPTGDLPSDYWKESAYVVGREEPKRGKK